MPKSPELIILIVFVLLCMYVCASHIKYIYIIFWIAWELLNPWGLLATDRQSSSCACRREEGRSGGRGEGVSYLLMLIKVRRRDGKVPQLLSLMQAASSGQQLCLSNCQMGHQATVVVAHCAGKELFGIQLIVQRERERERNLD